jgi:hypothetical protein
LDILRSSGTELPILGRQFQNERTVRKYVSKYFLLLMSVFGAIMALIVFVFLLKTRYIKPNNSLRFTTPAIEAKGSVVAASPPPIPPGYSSEVIHVKFREGTEVQTLGALLPPDLRDSVVSISRLFSLPKERLEQMEGSRLNLWFRIILRPGTDAATFLEELKHLDSVEVAEPAPLPAPPPR